MKRIFVLFALYVYGVTAQELSEGLQVHGFFSQNALVTSANNLFGQTDHQTSFDLREIGLNASWQFHPRWRIAAQGLSRWAGEADAGTPRLDFMLVDYAWLATSRYESGVRVGRVFNPLGLYNETRDMAFTRNSILLPQSIYFDRTRDMAISSDGAQLYLNTRGIFGDLSLQLQTGLPRVNTGSVETALLGLDLPGKLEGKPSIIGRLLYEQDGGALRLALSGGFVDMDFEPGKVNILPKGSTYFKPVILSVQYNTERWTLTSEYALRGFEHTGLGQPSSSIWGESFYAEALYRFNPQWDVLARYDVLFNNRNDRDGEEFAERTGRTAFSQFAKDLAFGLTWRVTPKVMLRAEYHAVDGTAWLPLEDNPNASTLERYWSIWALQFAMRF